MSSATSVVRIFFCLISTAAIFAVGAVSPDDIQVLTLNAAEQLARQSDPLVSRFQRLAEARRQGSVADGQLPDPKLKLGLANFPADDLSRTKEPMTQIRVGVVQAFPRGDTLTFKQRQGESFGDTEQARSEDQLLKVLRDTREAWLDVYFQVHALEIIESSRGYFSQLLDITQAHYGAGRANQQDVLRAQLELSRLEDRKTRMRADEDTARAELAKWVGNAALRPLSEILPHQSQPPALAELEERISVHPSVRVENARVRANRLGVKIAREQYKPGWALDLTYGQRGGNNPDGRDRPDFLSAMVVMDMPLFTEKRQDRRVAASEQEIGAALDARDDRLRELKRSLHSAYARWRGFGERIALYEERLVLEAQANVGAALRAYQSGITEFTTLMRARITDLDTRLQALRLRVDLAKEQARLRYIGGNDL